MPFKIIRNDITRMHTDAIVNSANPEPVVGRGTDLAIYQAAGIEKLLEKRRKIGSIKPGDAEITKGFDLHVKYIIHTVGPEWTGGGREEAVLRNCYLNSLRIAKRYHCRSIAFPLISAGYYRFPEGKALHIALDAIYEFLLDEDMEIYLVVYGESSLRESKKLFHDIEDYISARNTSGYTAGLPDLRPYFANSAREEGCKPYSESPDSSAFLDIYANTGETFDEDYAAKYDDSDAAAARPLESAAPTLFRKAASPRSLSEVLGNVGETFQQQLFRLIREKGMTNVEVYKKANLDRKLFAKIKANKDYVPKKQTAVSLAIALELNLDETRDLIARAGYAFSPSSRSDLVISYFIEHQIFDVYQIDVALFEYHLPMLSNY